MDNKKSISLNMVSSLLLQFVEIISTLIIPRLIISTFGSEVNGLVSSLNQFLNYVSLLEGGVASVMMANLYRPLLEKDDAKLSSIYAAMQRFFKRISVILVIYAIILAIVYPFLINSSFSWGYISSLTVILAFTLFIKYVFSMSNKLVLNSDNKIYITSFIQIIVVLLNTVLVYITIAVLPNIHIVKLVTGLALLIQPIGYSYYIKKYYHIDKSAEPDQKAIDQRWDGFAINLAYFVHNNTDVVVLSLFSTLSMVSVYSVYLMVFQGIKSIVGAITSSLIPTLGKKIAKGDAAELNSYFDLFEFFSISVSYLAYAYGWILLVPFVTLYTHRINDVNYIQPVFATILAAAELVYSVRDPYLNLAYNANHFKSISRYAYCEAILNIIISIPAVIYFGLEGVAFGTLIAMLYRAVTALVYMKRNLLDRSYIIFIKYNVTYMLMTIATYLIVTKAVDYNINSIYDFIALAACAGIVLLFMYIMVSLVFHREIFVRIVHYLKR